MRAAVDLSLNARFLVEYEEHLHVRVDLIVLIWHTLQTLCFEHIDDQVTAFAETRWNTILTRKGIQTKRNDENMPDAFGKVYIISRTIIDAFFRFKYWFLYSLIESSIMNVLRMK